MLLRLALALPRPAATLLPGWLIIHVPFLSLDQGSSPVACHALKQSHAAEDDVITPEDVFDLMEEDLKVADLILWVGISFEQSASTAYFRRVSIRVSGRGMFPSSTPVEQWHLLAYSPGSSSLLTKACCRAYMNGLSVNSVQSSNCNPVSESRHGQIADASDVFWGVMPACMFLQQNWR